MFAVCLKLDYMQNAAWHAVAHRLDVLPTSTHNTRLSATFQLALQWGNDAAEAYEAFGEMLVGGGCVADDAAAHKACRKLQRLLVGGADDGASDARSSTAATCGTGASGRQGFRALEGGPELLNEVGVPADGAVWLHHESTRLLMNRLHR